MEKRNLVRARGETGGVASPGMRVQPSTSTRRLALAALLVSLYVVANGIPIDAFIGGAGFITAGIVLLPVVAGLLKPREALLAAVLASIGLFAFQLSIIPIFGFFGLLVPILGIFFGSLGFHRSLAFPAVYVIFGAFWYAFYSGGTVVWLAPYALAIALIAVKATGVLRPGQKFDLVVFCFAATMCELVTMNIGSISLLHLPGPVWVLITPFMLLERGVAVVGSSAILLGLNRLKAPLKLEWTLDV